MAIIGLSGSPFVRGNTDRLVRAVLKKSGRETVFVNLSRLSFDPVPRMRPSLWNNEYVW